MTRPYSQDLRDRVMAAVQAGQSRRGVARIFSLGPATVVRWVDRQRTSGACAAKPMGGVRHAVLLHERDWLLARIAAVPDLTVRGLRAELAGRGTRVSNDAVWRFLRNARLTFKKACGRLSRTAQTLHAGASDGDDTKARLIPVA